MPTLLISLCCYENLIKHCIQKGFQTVEDPTNVKSGYAGEQTCKTDLTLLALVLFPFQGGVEDDPRQLSLVEVFIIPDHMPRKIEMYKGCVILQ